MSGNRQSGTAMFLASQGRGQAPAAQPKRRRQNRKRKNKKAKNPQPQRKMARARSAKQKVVITATPRPRNIPRIDPRGDYDRWVLEYLHHLADPLLSYTPPGLQTRIGTAGMPSDTINPSTVPGTDPYRWAYNIGGTLSGGAEGDGALWIGPPPTLARPVDSGYYLTRGCVRAVLRTKVPISAVTTVLIFPTPWLRDRPLTALDITSPGGITELNFGAREDGSAYETPLELVNPGWKADPYSVSAVLVTSGGPQARTPRDTDRKPQGLGNLPQPTYSHKYDIANRYFFGGLTMKAELKNIGVTDLVNVRTRTESNWYHRFDEMLDRLITNPKELAWKENPVPANGAISNYSGINWQSTKELAGISAHVDRVTDALSSLRENIGFRYPLTEITLLPTSLGSTTTNYEFNIEIDCWLAVAPTRIQYAAAAPFTTKCYTLPVWAAGVSLSSVLVPRNGHTASAPAQLALQSYSGLSTVIPATPLENTLVKSSPAGVAALAAAAPPTVQQQLTKSTGHKVGDVFRTIGSISNKVSKAGVINPEIGAAASVVGDIADFASSIADLF